MFDIQNYIAEHRLEADMGAFRKPIVQIAH